MSTLTLAHILGTEPGLKLGTGTWEISLEPKGWLEPTPLAAGIFIVERQAWFIKSAAGQAVPKGQLPLPIQWLAIGSGDSATFTPPTETSLVARIKNADTGPLGMVWTGLSLLGGAPQGDGLWLLGSLTETNFIGEFRWGDSKPITMGPVHISDVQLRYLAARPFPRGAAAKAQEAAVAAQTGTAAQRQDAARRVGQSGDGDPMLTTLLTPPSRGIAWLELEAEVKLGSKRPITAHLQCEHSGAGSLFIFRGDIEGVTLENGLGELGDIIGTDLDLERNLPSSLKGLASLGITFLEVGIDTVGKSLSLDSFAVTVGAGPDARWTLFPDLIEIASPSLTLRGRQLANKAQREWEFLIGAEFILAGAPFDVTLDIPLTAGDPVMVSAFLRMGNTIGVGKFLQSVLPFSLTGKDGKGLGSLVISSVGIAGQLSPPAFHFDLDVVGAWPLLPGLELSAIGVSLDFLGGTRGGISGELRAQLALCGKSGVLCGTDGRPAVLDLAAELPTEDSGFQLQGSLGGDLPLAGFLDWLETVFHVPSTEWPSVLNDFVIENFAFFVDSRSHDGQLQLIGKLTLDEGVALEATLSLELHRRPSAGFEKKFTGVIRLELANGKRLQFFLAVDNTPAGSALVAGYSDVTGCEVSVQDLLQKTGWKDAPGAGLNFTLRQAALAKNASKWLFNLDIDAGLNLGRLQLPGLALAGTGGPQRVDKLELAFQVLAAKDKTDAGVTSQDIADFNALLPPGTVPLPTPSKLPLANKEVFLDTKLRIGTLIVDIPLQLQAGGGSGENKDAIVPADNAPAPAPTTPSGTSGGNTQWVSVQRNFGPVHVDKIGVSYEGGRVHGPMSGALTAGGLTLSLMGVGFSSKISPPSPSFSLNGLGIDYRNGALEIGGALLRQEVQQAGGPVTEFNGLAVLKMKTFSLSAIGSFAKLKDDVSLFIYAVLNYPLGGPSFFFVTGLAAGFGLHRRLVMPTLPNVGKFPLVALAMAPAAAPQQSTADTLATILTDLDEYLPIDAGINFFCAGIKFTSFNIIDSFALLAVQFGRQLEIDLLGLSRVTVPPQAPVGTPLLAQVELAIRAVFLPEEGFLGVEAQLTPASFILSPDCHLTGGFAFYSWFIGPHSGDFVLTLGGYHPAFKVPDHYPRNVPRLGFNWQVSDSLSFKGGIYYALTGNAFMAGGSFAANYEGGWVRAWFTCGADFLVTFKPFHYDASIYIGMGAEATIHFFGTHHLSFDAGADLHLWGPPLTGQAHVYLKVWIVHVSFDVNFGNGPALPRPIEWLEFKKSFLPAPENGVEKICTLAVEKGLLKEVAEGNAPRWIVNGKDFVVAATSLIPSTQCLPDETLAAAPAKLCIQPMGLATAEAKLEVTLTRNVGGKDLPVTLSPLKSSDPAQSGAASMSFERIRKPMPSGLWGRPELHDGFLVPPDLNAPGLIDGLAGLRLAAAEPRHEHTHSVPRKNLKFETTRAKPCPWRKVSGFKAWAPVPQANSTAAVARLDAWGEVEKSLSKVREDQAALLKDLGLTPADINLRQDFKSTTLAAPQLSLESPVQP